MMKIRSLVLLSFFALGVHGLCRGQSSVSPIALVDLEVPMAPTPVKANNKTHLFYELHLTSFDPRELTLKRVEVLTGDGAPLEQYEDTPLTNRLGRIGAQASLPDKRRIGTGLRAIVFLWLPFDASATVPKVLRHRLVFTVSEAKENSDKGEKGNQEVEKVVEGAVIAVRQEPPLVIGPPLVGGEWVAAGGPNNRSEHRRSLVAVDGKARIAQRFAIDWVKVDQKGEIHSGDALKNSSYYGYGQEVLAVADAVVASIKDGIPENVPGEKSRAVPITLETVGGNYVILDLGNSRFAFYAHLQTSSLRVKPGDKVKRGQVLGLLGNSGNSDGPHLHFHIGDGNSPLGCEGLPYVFESFEARPPQPNSIFLKRERQMPLENAVVRFP